MESMPAQAPQQKSRISMKSLIAVSGLFAIIGLIYFWLKSKKNTSAPVDNTASTKTDKESDTSKSNSSGSGGVSVTPLLTSISITEESLTVSPFINQFHLQCKVTIQNPPASGTLQILFDNDSIDSVSLPVQNNIYLVDSYVEIAPANQSSPHTLTAKVGSVTKSVSLQL